MSPSGKCAQVGMFENVHSLEKNEKLLLSRNKEWRQPNIGQTSNDASIITLQLNPTRVTVLPAPHGKGNECEFTRTR